MWGEFTKPALPSHCHVNSTYKIITEMNSRLLKKERIPLSCLVSWRTNTVAVETEDSTPLMPKPIIGHAPERFHPAHIRTVSGVID